MAAAAGEPHPRLEDVALLLERFPVGVERREPCRRPLGDELEGTPLEIRAQRLQRRGRRGHAVLGEAHARPRDVAVDHLALERLREHALLLAGHAEDRERLVARRALEVRAHARAARQDLADVARRREERPQPRLGRPALRSQRDRRGQLGDQRARELERALRRLRERPAAAAHEREPRVDPLDQVVERGADLRVDGVAITEEAEQHG